MKNNKLLSFILVLTLMMSLVVFTGCAKTTQENQVVNFYGWGGDENVNSWIDNELAPYVKENNNITLNRVPMNIDEILLKLTDEKSSNKTGAIDIVWINGENFYSAKKNNLLYGPILNNLENAKKYYDLEGGSATTDFGYATEGYEAPWGTAQFTFNYDSAKVKLAPANADTLKEYVKNNPGRFTYPQSSDFSGSAFIRTVLYDIVGYDNLKDLEPNYDTVKKAITPAIDYFKEIEPYLWKKGQVYPSDSSQLDNLYKDGQIDITMSYTANKALGLVKSKSWPSTTRTAVWDKGTPFNTHYLAIPANAPNVEGALNVINAALSPAMQISKANLNVWADLPTIQYEKLSSEEKGNLDKILTPTEGYADSILKYEELSKHQKPELKADLVVIIEKVWEDVILFDK
ncbi:ABC transporter substrate-binding protein [Clostridium sp. CS001]|uniref:ABC transporter substrate-binding protein n=1 Tax=Clostridium sp. CS001 TaxID=2880648 RepID=UPI001CF125B1|nr:ABC transporter substrate-binding protein [Clostridium sp. CS001]MCB2289934.1 ABC transporter substrate-binding protein [Clostridium sp. CS001]